MKKITKSACAIFGVFMIADYAFAGAGANTNVCINLATPPASPLKVSVKVGGSGTHCMNDKGNDATITASGVGLSCASVGYVEEKGSSTKGDTCATDTSTWPVSYTVKGQSYSGAARLHMSRGTTANQVSISDQSKDTVICNSEAVCVSTSTSWNHGTQGPLYVIFQPQASSN